MQGGRFLLVLGTRECILVEVRVDLSSRNRTVRKGSGGKGTRRKDNRDKNGEVMKDATCMTESQ